MAALPTSLAPRAGLRAFVRVWFDDGSHGFHALSPDLELRSVPFAREAFTAQNAISVGGISLANLARLDSANTFTAVNGLTVTGPGPSNGTPASGSTVPVTGAGTRLEFLPGYSALRAGTVTGNQWDAANIGSCSTALGYDTTARGHFSTALGAATTASGICSTALGAATFASADASTAFGTYTIASGYNATALGSFTAAESAFETVLGRYNTDYTPSSTTT